MPVIHPSFGSFRDTNWSSLFSSSTKRKTLRTRFKALPHRHLIEKTLVNIVRVYPQHTQDSDCNYDADDEDDSSSHDVDTVQSMLTLTSKLNSSRILFNHFQG